MPQSIFIPISFNTTSGLQAAMTSDSIMNEITMEKCFFKLVT